MPEPTKIVDQYEPIVKQFAVTFGAPNGVAVPVSETNPLPVSIPVLSGIAVTSVQLPATLGAKTGAESLSIVPATGSTFAISAASLPLPTGAATSAAQTTGNNSLAAIDTKLGGTIAISAASLPLPAGAATAAGLSTINTTLGTPFQAGGSIANTVFGATQSGVWDIRNITGSITLPTGAATSALQTTGNTSLASIDGKLPASLGIKTAAASLSVAPASDAIFQVNSVRSTTPTNRSGTITTGGTAQQLMAANATRRGWSIKNQSAGSLWFNELGVTAVADQPSFELRPNESYTSEAGVSSVAAISIIGATTSQAFAAREW